jgi:hypothetical protein
MIGNVNALGPKFYSFTPDFSVPLSGHKKTRAVHRPARVTVRKIPLRGNRYLA